MMKTQNTMRIIFCFCIASQLLFVLSFFLIQFVNACKLNDVRTECQGLYYSYTVVLIVAIHMTIRIIALRPWTSRCWLWSSTENDEEDDMQKCVSQTLFGTWETRESSLRFALKPAFTFFALWIGFHPVYNMRSSRMFGFRVFIAYVLDGFLVAQVFKHLRSHYSFFICLLAFAVCGSYDVFGATHVYTLVVGGLCLNLIFFNHLLPVYDDEAHLIRLYGSYTSRPRHKVNNYPRGATLLVEAAEMGNPDALYELGCRLRVENNYVESAQQAFYYIEKAVEQLHPGALYLLCAVYLTGDCVKQDIASAIWCFHRAAEKGHAGAAIAYGSLLHKGVQVPEHLTKFNVKKRGKKNEGSMSVDPIEAAKKQFQVAAKAGCDLGFRWLDKLDEDKQSSTVS